MKWPGHDHKTAPFIYYILQIAHFKCLESNLPIHFLSLIEAFIALSLNLMSSTRCLGTFGKIVFELASSLSFQRPKEFLMKELVSFLLL